MENVTHGRPLNQVSPENLKVLRSSTLKLYIQRIDRGLPVTRTDLLNLAFYFPEGSEAA